MLINALEKQLNNILKKYDIKSKNILSFSDHSDISSNIAFLLTKKLRKSPKEIAEQIIKELNTDNFEKIEVVNGFINFFYKKEVLANELLEIIKNKNYGKKDKNNKSLNIEFVSANPTGPLVLVNARAGIVGDLLGKIFEFYGYDVVRETYINDAGNQVISLGKSILYHIVNDSSIEFPKDGYKGKYIEEIAQTIREKLDNIEWNEENVKKCARMGVDYILKWQRETLKKYSIKFDKWTFETDIRKTGYIEEILNIFKEKDLIYKKDNAVFFKSSSIYDDKDRVIIKSDGNYSYLLPDIAYHYDKVQRGFDKIIDILGPDHHGHINRLRSAMKVLSENTDFEVIISQLITLYKNGKKYEMSKRKGDFITMDELAEEIDINVLKFIFLTRKLSQPLDFDLEKAKEQTMDNPVYYVQYAHARICSVFEKANYKEYENILINKILENEEIRKIIIKIIQFPYILYSIAQNYEIQKLPNYLIELSEQLHKFYHKHKIITNDEQMKEKLLLIYAVRETIRRGFDFMNIEPLNRMETNE